MQFKHSIIFVEINRSDTLEKSNTIAFILAYDKFAPVLETAVKKKRIVPNEQISSAVDEILGSYFCLPSVMCGVSEERLHDDHDGQMEGKICVTMGPDGDMWVSLSFPRICITPEEIEKISVTHSPSLRFRMPLCGGGLSHHTRNALLILARGIQLDKEQRETLLY